MNIQNNIFIFVPLKYFYIKMVKPVYGLKLLNVICNLIHCIKTSLCVVTIIRHHGLPSGPEANLIINLYEDLKQMFINFK